MTQESHRRAACDLLVVGGGINGTGIARDAAGRGLRTVLCEQHDLGAHTSSASTKLVHGGLRYLEFYDFGLVRKSLREREIVLASAPHLAWPLRFVLPHDRHLRPAWMVRAGLLLYDHLAVRRRLPGSETVNLRRHPAGAPLDERYRTGFVYSDGWVDDARLVLVNAVDAHERGARVLTRTRCTALRPGGQGWIATLTHADGGSEQLSARLVVNAAGPWVAQFLDEHTPRAAKHHPRMIQGSHIVVPRLFDHAYAYIFQAPDGRVVFAIPFERDFTLVGTTEREYDGDLATPQIAPDEVRYLLEMVNRYFRRDLTRRDVVWTFAGLRPLLAASTQDPKSVTRDYVLDFDRNGPPLLSIYGGKLTTYRRLAEQVVDLICAELGVVARAWTAAAPLPGGDMPGGDFERFRTRMARRYAWLDRALLNRYARAYGTRMERLLEGCTGMDGLGKAVLPGLTEREIDYLQREEFAITADDILFRRTKLGVHLPAGSAARLERWLANRTAAAQ
ncbi:MAG TPA: glycerol-3-phosphate dehydrogenase [Steroidobacteraceae bacterium]|nr:glycerol-3-phosphate dehydrogenase [Steroidobacteraceae bacterium]